MLIYETSGGKCGLQSQNRKRLYAPDLHEKTIKLQQETPVQHSQYSSTTTAEDRESNINWGEIFSKILCIKDQSRRLGNQDIKGQSVGWKENYPGDLVDFIFF